jgi:hypothetical protein
MIPLMDDWMRKHDAIFLEEPPESNFLPMLQGSIAIDDYLTPLDVEYPEFSSRMCRLLRNLHAAGKKIYQVEPFLQVLVGIHHFFAEGHLPAELAKDSIEYPVYQVERKATGSLLAYYQTAIGGSFEETLSSIINFARADAARFRLRDSLRAQALAPLIVRYSSAYVEAGAIHFQLRQLLRQKLPKPNRVQPVFTAEFALKEPIAARYLYGPGDLLTLQFIFHPTMPENGRHRLLAARSMVYAKVVEKNEITAGPGKFPHLLDEMECIKSTGELSLQDCGVLFPRLRRANSAEARQIVADYLAATG